MALQNHCENHQAEILQAIKDLHNAANTSNVILVCWGKRVVHAHMLVLSLRSPLLKKMLAEVDSCEHLVIMMMDFVFPEVSVKTSWTSQIIT